MARQSRPTVILTRPRLVAARFAAQLQARFGQDLPILLSPLLEPGFRAPALPAMPVAGVIFTSETGVAGLARLSAHRGPAICVGPGTAAAASAAGWQAEVLGGDAAGLLDALSSHPRPGQWLHARGEHAIADLAGLLSGLGMQTSDVIVYSQDILPLSAAAHAALRRPDPVILPVFSPRSARVFVAQAGEVTAALSLAAISAAAAAPLASLHPARQVIAATPDAPGMLDAVAMLLAQHGDA